MTSPLLTFELEADGQTLCVHGDELGLRRLQEALGRLVDATPPGGFSHDHLKTPEWGGSELSSESQGGKLVNHVKLCCWKGNVPDNEMR